MMALPPAYAWLDHETELPAMLQAFRADYGLKETIGPGDNPVILRWAQELGGQIAAIYKHDDIPWCGLGVSHWAQQAGLEWPSLGIRASAWDFWGIGVSEAMLGDVLRFEREGGGHVGLYVGEDEDCFHVAGANQGDAVSIIRMGKFRLKAVRRPAGIVAARRTFFGDPTSGVRKVMLAASGAVSGNEK